jgi:hypothetical protein
VADYVYENTPPPPELRRAFDYRAWGVDVFRLPPGELRAINQAMKTYNTLTSYRRAASKQQASEWTEQNPEDWDFVSRILADRMRRAREAGNV